MQAKVRPARLAVAVAVAVAASTLTPFRPLPPQDAARPEFWASLGPTSAFCQDQPIMQHWYARQGCEYRGSALTRPHALGPRLDIPAAARSCERPDEVFAEDVPRYHTTNTAGAPMVVGLTLMRKVLRADPGPPPSTEAAAVA